MRSMGFEPIWLINPGFLRPVRMPIPPTSHDMGIIHPQEALKEIKQDFKRIDFQIVK